jgi:hypothetical protein
LSGIRQAKQSNSIILAVAIALEKLKILGDRDSVKPIPYFRWDSHSRLPINP